MLPVLVVLLPLGCGASVNDAIVPVTSEFYGVLISLSNPEGPVIRKKVIPMLYKLSQDSYEDTTVIDCLWGLLHTLSNELNCTTSSTELLKNVNNLEWVSLYTNVTFLESLLQKDCSMLRGRNKWFCEQHLAGILPHDIENLNLPQIIYDCYVGYIRRLKHLLSYR